MTEPFLHTIWDPFPPCHSIYNISRGCSFHTVLTGTLISIALLFMRTTVALFFYIYFQNFAKAIIGFAYPRLREKIDKVLW